MKTAATAFWPIGIFRGIRALGSVLLLATMLLFGIDGTAQHPASLRMLLAASSAFPGRTAPAQTIGADCHAKSLNLPIIRVMQVRQLSPFQAERHMPLKLTGVVTDLSGYKNSFFFQDATGGISVDRTDSADIHRGDKVEIQGTSGPGLFAPVVLASQVTRIGHGPPPMARRFTYGDLFGGSQDSQWIEIEGIVHSARIEDVDDHRVLMLHLQMGGGPVNVLIHDFSGIDFAHLVDAKIRFRGVCATDFNNKKQFVGLELYVPSRHFFEVLEPANADPFAIPAMPVDNALQFGQAQHRVRVIGTSTYQPTGLGVFLQNGNDGIRIQAAFRQSIGINRLIEAVGFPVSGDYGPILQDALLHELGPATPVAPLRVEARNVITQLGDFYQVPYDEQLVQLRGTVEESHLTAGQQVLMLRDGNDVFTASLPLSIAGSSHKFGNGSIVLLTGICAVHADIDHNPISFSILLRSEQDILIQKRASWWTTGHTLIVLAMLAGLTLLVILWVVVLRHRVEQQTQIIRQSEERFRHLAQHDYLTGLPNRLMLEEHISTCLATCKADRTMASVFTLDIDHFKKINDTYGHLIGDECLKVVATRLRGTVRRMDVIARTGGEEFMLVVGGLQDQRTAERIASEVLELFCGTVPMQGLRVRLTVSIGAALFPDDATDSASLRRMSDQALYRAKQSGRNMACFANQADSPPVTLAEPLPFASYP